jgi:hypothetical protein
MVLPTFVGLGAQRAGTTWAYNCLAEHPDIFMTRKKELHFFYVNYDRGLAWYTQQFAEAGDCTARGEITPDYMYHEKALRNIARDVPEARAFVILRNPIDRAISAFALHNQRFSGMTFRQACEADPELIERGMYYRYLKQVHAYLGSDKVSVFFYDDLAEKPLEFVSDLYRMAGVDASFVPSSLETRYNRVVYPKLQRAIIAARLGWTIEAVKKTPVGNWLRRRNSGSRRESSVVSAEDMDMLRSVYRSDVERLSDYVDRDLRHWLEK